MMQRYTIPKKRYSTSVEGNRHPVTSPREKVDLFNIIKHSCLDANVVPRYWKVRSTTIVHRSDWQESFHQKRLELRQTLKHDPKVTYTYGLVRKDSLADEICEKGTFKLHDVHHGIGDVEKGAILFSHPDVLTEWARKKQHANPSLIIYKIFKGRSKLIPPRYSAKPFDPPPKPFDPSPNYECHVLKAVAKASDTLIGRMEKSQIFVYEYDEDYILQKHPRHCLPYAVVCLERDRSIPARSSNHSSVTVPPKNITMSPTMWLQEVQTSQRFNQTARVLQPLENVTPTLSEQTEENDFDKELVSSDTDDSGDESPSDFIDVLPNGLTPMDEEEQQLPNYSDNEGGLNDLMNSDAAGYISFAADDSPKECNPDENSELTLDMETPLKESSDTSCSSDRHNDVAMNSDSAGYISFAVDDSPKETTLNKNSELKIDKDTPSKKSSDASCSSESSDSESSSSESELSESDDEEIEAPAENSVRTSKSVATAHSIDANSTREALVPTTPEVPLIETHTSPREATLDENSELMIDRDNLSKESSGTSCSNDSDSSSSESELSESEEEEIEAPAEKSVRTSESVASTHSIDANSNRETHFPKTPEIPPIEAPTPPTSSMKAVVLDNVNVDVNQGSDCEESCKKSENEAVISNESSEHVIDVVVKSGSESRMISENEAVMNSDNKSDEVIENNRTFTDDEKAKSIGHLTNACVNFEGSAAEPMDFDDTSDDHYVMSDNDNVKNRYDTTSCSSLTPSESENVASANESDNRNMPRQMYMDTDSVKREKHENRRKVLQSPCNSNELVHGRMNEIAVTPTTVFPRIITTVEERKPKKLTPTIVITTVEDRKPKKLTPPLSKLLSPLAKKSSPHVPKKLSPPVPSQLTSAAHLETKHKKLLSRQQRSEIERRRLASKKLSGDSSADEANDDNLNPLDKPKRENLKKIKSKTKKLAICDSDKPMEIKCDPTLSVSSTKRIKSEGSVNNSSAQAGKLNETLTRLNKEILEKSKKLQEPKVKNSGARLENVKLEDIQGLSFKQSVKIVENAKEPSAVTEFKNRNEGSSPKNATAIKQERREASLGSTTKSAPVVSDKQNILIKNIDATEKRVSKVDPSKTENASSGDNPAESSKTTKFTSSAANKRPKTKPSISQSNSRPKKIQKDNAKDDRGKTKDTLKQDHRSKIKEESKISSPPIATETSIKKKPLSAKPKSTSEHESHHKPRGIPKSSVTNELQIAKSKHASPDQGNLNVNKSKETLKSCNLPTSTKVSVVKASQEPKIRRAFSEKKQCIKPEIASLPDPLNDSKATPTKKAQNVKSKGALSEQEFRDKTKEASTSVTKNPQISKTKHASSDHKQRSKSQDKHNSEQEFRGKTKEATKSSDLSTSHSKDTQISKTRRDSSDHIQRSKSQDKHNSSCLTTGSKTADTSDPQATKATSNHSKTPQKAPNNMSTKSKGQPGEEHKHRHDINKNNEKILSIKVDNHKRSHEKRPTEDKEVSKVPAEKSKRQYSKSRHHSGDGSRNAQKIPSLLDFNVAKRESKARRVHQDRGVSSKNLRQLRDDRKMRSPSRVNNRRHITRFPPRGRGRGFPPRGRGRGSSNTRSYRRHHDRDISYGDHRPSNDCPPRKLDVMDYNHGQSSSGSDFSAREESWQRHREVIPSEPVPPIPETPAPHDQRSRLVINGEHSLTTRPDMPFLRDDFHQPFVGTVSAITPSDMPLLRDTVPQPFVETAPVSTQPDMIIPRDFHPAFIQPGITLPTDNSMPLVTDNVPIVMFPTTAYSQSVEQLPPRPWNSYETAHPMNNYEMTSCVPVDKNTEVVDMDLDDSGCFNKPLVVDYVHGNSNPVQVGVVNYEHGSNDNVPQQVTCNLPVNRTEYMTLPYVASGQFYTQATNLLHVPDNQPPMPQEVPPSRPRLPSSDPSAYGAPGSWKTSEPPLPQETAEVHIPPSIKSDEKLPGISIKCLNFYERKLESLKNTSDQLAVDYCLEQIMEIKMQELKQNGIASKTQDIQKPLSSSIATAEINLKIEAQKVSKPESIGQLSDQLKAVGQASLSPSLAEPPSPTKPSMAPRLPDQSACEQQIKDIPQDVDPDLPADDRPFDPRGLSCSYPSPVKAHILSTELIVFPWSPKKVVHNPEVIIERPPDNKCSVPNSERLQSGGIKREERKPSSIKSRKRSLDYGNESVLKTPVSPDQDEALDPDLIKKIKEMRRSVKQAKCVESDEQSGVRSSLSGKGRIKLPGVVNVSIHEKPAIKQIPETDTSKQEVKVIDLDGDPIGTTKNFRGMNENALRHKGTLPAQACVKNSLHPKEMQKRKSDNHIPEINDLKRARPSSSTSKNNTSQPAQKTKNNIPETDAVPKGMKKTNERNDSRVRSPGSKIECSNSKVKRPDSNVKSQKISKEKATVQMAMQTSQPVQKTKETVPCLLKKTDTVPKRRKSIDKGNDPVIESQDVKVQRLDSKVKSPEKKLMSHHATAELQNKDKQLVHGKKPQRNKQNDSNARSDHRGRDHHKSQNVSIAEKEVRRNQEITEMMSRLQELKHVTNSHSHDKHKRPSRANDRRHGSHSPPRGRGRGITHSNPRRHGRDFPHYGNRSTSFNNARDVSHNDHRSTSINGANDERRCSGPDRSAGLPPYHADTRSFHGDRDERRCNGPDRSAGLPPDHANARSFHGDKDEGRWVGSDRSEDFAPSHAHQRPPYHDYNR